MLSFRSFFILFPFASGRVLFPNKSNNSNLYNKMIVKILYEKEPHAEAGSWIWVGSQDSTMVRFATYI